MKTEERLPNNYNVVTFQELIFTPHPMGMGEQCIVRFPNGFAASIVKGPYTYGGPEGLYEIAVFDKEGNITYDTPITDDVLGYLNETDVSDTLIKIKEL